MIMNSNTVKVYEILKETFGQIKATTVLEYLEHETSLKVAKEMKNKVEHLASKEDIFKLETVISDKYANTIKWLFLFWVGTIGSILAIIKLS